mmetsp:Transcript_18352/g.42322  ORF Transcript_18352/g.42322 Transcript_18352/m.42322 type:complete len:325 (+) Transcript_18352:3999-4973(+)
MTRAPPVLVSPRSSMRAGSVVRASFLAPSSEGVVVAVVVTSFEIAFSSCGDPSEVSSPEKVLTATSLPFHGTLRVTPPAPLPSSGHESSSRTGSSRTGSERWLLLSSPPLLSAAASKKGFPAKAAHLRFVHDSKSSMGGSASWLQASRMSSRFFSSDQIFDEGNSEMRFPESMNFWSFRHRPMVSGIAEILFPVRISHRSWGCKASGWIDSMVWHSLKDTICRLAHFPIREGTSTNLFFGQNKMDREGQIFGRHDGNSVRPRFGRSSFVRADRSAADGFAIIVNVGLFLSNHSRCCSSLVSSRKHSVMVDFSLLNYTAYVLVGS